MSQLTDQILALQATSRTEFDLRMEREIHRLRFDFFLCRTIFLSIPYFLLSVNLNPILALYVYVYVYLSLPIFLSLFLSPIYNSLVFSTSLSLSLYPSLSSSLISLCRLHLLLFFILFPLTI